MSGLKICTFLICSFSGSDPGKAILTIEWLEAAQAFQVSLGAREPQGSLLSVHLNSPGAGSVIKWPGARAGERSFAAE